MPEVDGEDPALGVQELPLGRACASRRRVDAPGMQDLPYGGRRYGDAEFRQLAVDAAVSPQRILLRQANDEACGARECWRAAGLAPVARLVLLAASLRCQASSVAGRDGEDIGPAPARYEPCQRGEPHPVGRLVSHPASVAAQYRGSKFQ